MQRVSDTDPGEDAAIGLDAVLEWTHARYVARTAATALPPTSARLDEAHGAILARALVSPYDEPFADAAAHDGYAVCGEGPWHLADLAADVALSQHYAMRVRTLQILPGHTDAVLPVDRGVITTNEHGHEIVTARDPLTDLPEPSARPDFGTGIVRQGHIRSADTELVHALSPVTPATLALAAAAGLDTVEVITPPTVGTLVLGSTLLTSGPSREGRVRDALGMSIPALIGSLGARANPALRAPDTRDLLLREIDDSTADMLITTGSTSPDTTTGNNILRAALRDIGAHWLIDGISMTPGAQTLLVRLPDGRLLLGLPGHPTAALAGVLTLGAPLIAGLRGEAIDPTRTPANSTPANSTPPHAVLASPAPIPDYDDDTVLCPVRLTGREKGEPRAHPLPSDGPGYLGGWANAEAIAVIGPGSGAAGDVVVLLDPLGRPADR